MDRSSDGPGDQAGRGAAAGGRAAAAGDRAATAVLRVRVLVRPEHSPSRLREACALARPATKSAIGELADRTGRERRRRNGRSVRLAARSGAE